MILNSILRALRVASVTGIGACAVLTMAGALLVAPVARAVTPSAVSYQGLLLDSAGLPVTGVVSLKATLFDDLLAGSPLWSETHSSVDVLDGVYSVELGSITPITANILQSASVFIEIEIDSELLTPRQQLLAVPFAISAGSAAEAQNVGGVSSVFFMQMMEDFDFDGGPPSNLHASEGTSDVDGDGRANFLDADNDGDGIPDVGEPALGGDINLITPTITGYSPPTADGFDASPVSILGTNFTADSVVAFGTDSPSIVTFSANQIDVVVTPQPEGDATVTVTRPNGESATSTFSFFFIHADDHCVFSVEAYTRGSGHRDHRGRTLRTGHDRGLRGAESGPHESNAYQSGRIGGPFCLWLGRRQRESSERKIDCDQLSDQWRSSHLPLVHDDEWRPGWFGRSRRFLSVTRIRRIAPGSLSGLAQLEHRFAHNAASPGSGTLYEHQRRPRSQRLDRSHRRVSDERDRLRRIGCIHRPSRLDEYYARGRACLDDQYVWRLEHIGLDTLRHLR
jgi:IPT/TIG domain